jgi:hypothetical protein
MSQELTKYEVILADLESRVRFYINTPDRAGEALEFVKKLKEFAEAVEEKVKDRSREIMDQNNLEELEAGNYLVKIIKPSVSNVYRVPSLIEAMGIEMAQPFLEVNTRRFEDWVKKTRLDLGVYDKCRLGLTTKTRSGYLVIRPKK